MQPWKQQQKPVGWRSNDSFTARPAVSVWFAFEIGGWHEALRSLPWEVWSHPASMALSPVLLSKVPRKVFNQLAKDRDKVRLRTPT
jgi:hypothetical protein